MKLSIFSKAKPLPTKEEKPHEAKFASRPYLPEVVEVTTEDDIINVITNYAWSPTIFKHARLKEEFVSTDFLVLDIDSGLTIQEAESRVKEAGLICLCAPSTSHKPEAHRFRIIFPLSRTITKIEEFEASMENLINEGFPECDIGVARNPCAFYFGSTLNDGFWIEDGTLLEPVKAAKEEAIKRSNRPSSESKIPVDASISDLVKELYGQDKEFIPEAVSFFIKNASSGLSGEWTVSTNSFVYTLALQNIEEDIIYDIVEYLAPEPLDKRDIDCIKRAYRDGQRDREEE